MLTAKQVVAMLNGAISLSQVYALARSGRLRSTRELGKLLIYPEGIRAILEPARPAPPPAPAPNPNPARNQHGSRRAKVNLW